MEVKSISFAFADVNECANAESNDCGANALCTNTNGSYSCRCLVGYQGDGVVCTGEVLPDKIVTLCWNVRSSYLFHSIESTHAFPLLIVFFISLLCNIHAK